MKFLKKAPVYFDVGQCCRFAGLFLSGGQAAQNAKDDLRASSGRCLLMNRPMGYTKGDQPAPFCGHFFRILTALGAKAKGGTNSYVGRDPCAGKQAAIAYPCIEFPLETRTADAPKGFGTLRRAIT
jgi:hypothetical protein